MRDRCGIYDHDGQFCVLRVQSQVDEVIDVMQENISKVIERGERLEDLQDKSGGPHFVCKHPTRVFLYINDRLLYK